MFYVLQNESTAALRRVPILLTDAATGSSAQTGIALTTIFPYVNINGGAFIGGTGSVAEAGFGQYYYEMALGETNTLGLAGIHITAAGCRNYDAIAQIAALNVYSNTGLGLTAFDVWSYDISGITAAGTAGSQLNLAALGTAGGGISAYDVWSFDYINAPGGVVPNSSAERLEDTRTNTYTIDSNTSNIASNVWNRDPIGSGDNTTGDYYSAYLYQLGIGATGYAGTSITAGDVWSYAGGRTITGGIADTVTDVTNGVIVTTNNDKTGYALSSTQTFDLTGNISGSVGSVTADVNVSTASMAGVANTVWSTLTAPYTTHATFGHQILRSDNAATIGEVTLHQSGGSKRVDADVHAFVNNTASATAMLNILTGIGASMTTNITGNITGNLSGSVGSVTSDVNVSTASMTGIAGTVWTTDISVYTSPQAGAIVTDIQTDTNTIITDISNVPNNVWSSDISGYSTPGEAGFELSQASSGAALTSGDIWSYATRTITGGIADTVTTLTDRSGFAITGGTITTVLDKTGYSLSSTQSFNLTGNITGNLSGSVGSVTDPVTVATASMTGIAGTVWSVASRTITGGTITTVSDKTGYSLSGTQSFNLTGDITGSLSGSVGSVTGSVGSVVSAVSLSTATQASIANSVWLTDVTSFTAPSAGEDLATAAVGGISPADVWTYASRTITGGIADTVTTLTNRSGFAITGGTITTVSDKTGYSLSGSQTFNLTGNITGSVSGSVGSVSGAVGSVSGAVGSVTGNVGGNVVGSVASVTAPVSITTAAMGSIGSTVWNYILSDSQSADTNLVAAGGGGISITAGDVWSYNTRTLTSGAGITVIGAVQLVNGPYRLTSNQNNNDGILDILQNSVQEINLNLIDGNGAPASTAGYGVAVNFFNEAGTAVTSYVPTVEYADGGVLTFEIDGAVTSTTGRYNLIVNLSGAGFLVKYGPLTTLVRPL